MTLKEKLLDIGLCIDNKYLYKNVELIESNRDTKRQKFKTEKHHIIPRKWFMLKHIEVDNSSDNVVNLLYKNHVLAHYYLYKCTINPISNINLEVFIRMTFYKIKMSNVDIDSLYNQLGDNIQELHEQYKILNSEQNRGKKPSEETLRKRSLALKGKKRSEETKAKMRKPKSALHIQHMREAQKCIVRKPEWIQKMKESKQGVHWFTNGVINVQSKQQPEGFWLGRTQIISEEQKEKIRQGRKKYGPWNKGLTKEDNPSLARPNNGKYQRKKNN